MPVLPFHPHKTATFTVVLSSIQKWSILLLLLLLLSDYTQDRELAVLMEVSTCVKVVNIDKIATHTTGNLKISKTQILII